MFKMRFKHVLYTREMFGVLYRSTFDFDFFGENDCAFRSVSDSVTFSVVLSDQSCMRGVLRCTECNIGQDRFANVC